MNKKDEALRMAIEFINSVHVGEWTGDISRHEVLAVIETALSEETYEGKITSMFTIPDANLTIEEAQKILKCLENMNE